MHKIIWIAQITHLCNAMNTIHHREPTPSCLPLETDDASTEFIADGIHVHPAMIRLALRAKRNQEIAVITDAIRATDLGDGDYHLGVLPIPPLQSEIVDKWGMNFSLAKPKVSGQNTCFLLNKKIR
ncbi:hypothetical protein [Siminovitchia sp. 179-K 8D1 HS]|uniref:hypothetical protein n=1 Tax=Siminovitchia sp. 179-K 8D1 HS TaxID=3142385 RepID=UPI0039A17A8B